MIQRPLGQKIWQIYEWSKSLSLRHFEDSSDEDKSDERYQLAVAHCKLTFICLFLFCTLQ